jgi:PAS domain S-box-containing protein
MMNTAYCYELDQSSGITPRERIYQDLFKNSQMVMLIISPSTGRIIDANDQACNFYGLSSHKLKTMRIQDINTLDESIVEEQMKSVKDKEENTFQFKHRLASGEIRDVEVVSTPISLGNKKVLYSIIKDITERNAREAERELLISELEKALIEIKTLKGIIPVCAGCQKIRDDQSYWQKVESYLEKNTYAELLHGICPDCCKKLYPDIPDEACY